MQKKKTTSKKQNKDHFETEKKALHRKVLFKQKQHKLKQMVFEEIVSNVL